MVALESAAVPQLTAGLRNYSGTPRQIARTLAELGRTAAASRDELINLLSSEDGYTLQTVGSALAAVAPFDQSVAVAMINAIKTKPGAGSQLRYALARMDASAAIEPLRQELAQGSSDATEAIVYALGELKEKAAPAVPDLIALLEAPAVTFQTKDEIMEAIGKIGPAASSTAVPLLKMINALSGFPRAKVIETLGKIHADRTIVVPQLIDMLQNEAKKPRGEKYKITSHVLEELEAQGVPPDVLAILEGFREFERDQALFSSLVARDIGSEQWNRYATQILKAAR